MVGIDRVYQTVQKILNKEQRGYLPPVEFNLFANQAQQEIFHSYFSLRNIVDTNSSDYSDIQKNVEEKISLFENETTIEKGTFTNSAGGTTDQYYEYPSNFYHLVSVIYPNDYRAEEVSAKHATYVKRSKYTKPSDKTPIYVRHEGGLVAMPDPEIPEGESSPSITINYVRIPNEVEWDYTMVNNKPLYNASTSTNFELHSSEITELVLKICQYAGVAVKAIDVAQATAQKEQQVTQSER